MRVMGAGARLGAQRWSQLLRNSLARTSGLIMLTTVATAGLGFAYWVVAARNYSPSAVGTAAVSVSVMTLASLVSILGTNSAVVQRIPQRRPGSEWSLTVTVGLGVAGLIGALAGLVGWGVMLGVTRSAALLGPGYLISLVGGVALTNCGMVLDSVWVVERAASVRLFTSILMSAIKLPLLLVPILHAHGAVGVQMGWSAAVLVSVAVAMGLLIRMRGYRPTWTGWRTETGAMRHSMAGNYVVSLGAMLPSYAVPVLVGVAVAASSTAYFYSAWRVGSFFFVAASAVSSALFAEGSRAPETAAGSARRALWLIVPGLMIAMLVCALLGPGLLQAFGTRYRTQALGLLLLLIAAAIPDALTSVYRTVLRLQNRYGQAAAFIWSLALVQVGLTWVLLPVWGITGAGAAWLVAEGLGVVYAGADMLHQRGRPPRRLVTRSGPPEPTNADEVLR
ncbi:MAG: lipopolysaccharide biosynthesis protein [Candidatus Dormibacteria bacterium]